MRFEAVVAMDDDGAEWTDDGVAER